MLARGSAPVGGVTGSDTFALCSGLGTMTALLPRGGILVEEDLGKRERERGRVDTFVVHVSILSSSFCRLAGRLGSVGSRRVELRQDSDGEEGSEKDKVRNTRL